MSQISDGLRILHSFDPTDEDFNGIANSDVATRKGWAELWAQQQAFLKGKFDASSSAVQALSVFSDPENVRRAIAIEDEYVNDPDHPERKRADYTIPPGIQVPMGLKKTFNEYKEQVAKTEGQITQTKAITQKVGKIIKDQTGVDLSDADGLEELAKSGKLYKVLSESADLTAQDIKTFGESIQSIAGARKSVIDVITAAAQAKKSVAEADAIARKFAPTLAKVGIGDGPGLVSFSAAIEDGSLMKRIEKLTTMVGQDGLTVADLQQITQTVKGLLEAHQLEAVAKYAEIKQEAEARSAHVQAGFMEQIFGPDGKRNLDELRGLTPAGPGYLKAKLSIPLAEAPTAEKNTGTRARHWPEIPIPGSN